LDVQENLRLGDDSSLDLRQAAGRDDKTSYFSTGLISELYLRRLYICNDRGKKTCSERHENDMHASDVTVKINLHFNLNGSNRMEKEIDTLPVTLKFTTF
jgi:hypothetical protein